MPVEKPRLDKLKILIDNSGYNLKNFGDTAMLQVAIQRFERLFPGAEIHVFTVAPEALKNLSPTAIPVPNELTLEARWLWALPWSIFGGLHKLLPGKYLKDSLYLLEIRLRRYFPDLTQRWINYRFKHVGAQLAHMNRVLELIKSADVVVATGGGYLTDSFNNLAQQILQTLALAQALGKPTALFGQGLGPLRQRTLSESARYTLNQLDMICLREENEGLPLLRKLGIEPSKIVVTGDDAVEFAYENRPKHLGGDIGINIRISHYSTLNANAADTLKPLLLAAKNAHHAKLRSIPISNNDDESDYASIRRTFGEILDEDGGDLNSPLDVIQEVGKCKVVITGSYHASVFALSQGVSVICLVTSLYYRHKFEGVAGMFKHGCYIVDLNDANLGENFKAAFENAWANAESASENLKLEAQKQIATGLGAYDRFVNIVATYQAKRAKVNKRIAG